jgi:hypothetical protein
MGLQHAEDERLAEALDAVRQAAGDPTLPVPSPAGASPAAGSTAGPPGEQLHLFDHQDVPLVAGR